MKGAGVVRPGYLSLREIRKKAARIRPSSSPLIRPRISSSKKSPPIHEETEIPYSCQQHRSAQHDQEVRNAIIHRPPEPAQLPAGYPKPAQKKKSNIQISSRLTRCNYRVRTRPLINRQRTRTITTLTFYILTPTTHKTSKKFRTQQKPEKRTNSNFGILAQKGKQDPTRCSVIILSNLPKQNKRNKITSLSKLQLFDAQHGNFTQKPPTKLINKQTTINYQDKAIQRKQIS